MATTKIHEEAQVSFLDFTAPTYVGFPGLERTLIAVFTFLDLLEQMTWLWIQEIAFKLGIDAVVVAAKTKPNWDDGSRYDLCEYQ